MNRVAKEILETIRYATISTTDKNEQPWAAPVWYVFDNDLDIYWWSPIGSQHSKNIERNSQIYITVFNSAAPEGEGKGLYFRATASVIEDNKLSKAITLYNKSTSIFKLSTGNCTGDAPTRLYKAIIQESWINDGLERDGFYVDRRVDL